MQEKLSVWITPVVFRDRIEDISVIVIMWARCMVLPTWAVSLDRNIKTLIQIFHDTIIILAMCKATVLWVLYMAM